MKSILSILIFLFAGITMANAAPGDTTRVRAHDATHLNWYGNFDRRAGFPSESVSYQKILLHYTMGCPSSGCSEWDYTTRVFVLRPTGQLDTNNNPIKEEIELCRVITPYAGNFATSWKWTYSFDVTDYEPLLHDSVDIRIQYQGYQDGFTATLDFEFIEGTPPHEVLDVVKLYEGGAPYGDVNNPIENFLAERSITVPSGTGYSKLVYRPSGHGFGGNENCAEFCPKFFYVLTDNTQRGQALIWNENCGANPLFPQPGTWLYDRANWCPGGPTGDFSFNLTPFLSPGAHTVNVNMEPFTNINNNSCSYNISGHLFHYGNASFTNDAELLEILAPSNNKNYGRFNPVCKEAQVVIRNYGSNPLTSAKIAYSIEGAGEYEVTWTGNLAFLQTDTFSFPLVSWENANTSKTFHVRIVDANNTADQYAANNAQTSKFAVPPVYPTTFVFEYKTNAAAWQNAWSIKDVNGNQLYGRNSHTANTLYKDTMTFDIGCYIFEFTDEGKDGLSFYSFNNDGAGYLRFKRAENTQIIKAFNANFGTFVKQQFTVGGFVSVDEEAETGYNLEVFPNPAGNQILIKANGLNGEALLKIFDMNGSMVKQQALIMENGTISLDISALASGVYLLNLENQKGSAVQKFIKE